MSVRRLFPTSFYAAPLQRTGLKAFNTRLLRECLQLRRDDRAGVAWSKERYPGGYTSYGSVNRMQRFSPTFAALERKLDRHVRAFARRLDFDLSSRSLAMTDCWVNIMPRLVTHAAHLHPLSTISGTYYVQVPRGSPGLKFEDPRLERMMAAPPTLEHARPENRRWHVHDAVAGHLVLFESWLRHEVAANSSTTERISISFNYNWF
jgi:uncharacterized protein (TIGR02466 family)